MVRYVDGALDAVLGAGRYAAWTAQRKVQLAVIEVRERLLQVTGQEVMTKDRVTLRLNLAAVYRVADARRLATVARAPDEVLYLAVQLSAREAVATRTLDALLAAREELGQALRRGVAERAAAVGLELLDLGLKDLVLPGEMKALLTVAQALTNAAVPELQLFVVGTPELAMPDNIAFQPGRGNWILHEDGDGPEVGRNNDLWSCLEDGDDADSLSDGCIRIGTLNDLNAEWTGGIFNARGSVFYVSVQHNVTGHGVILAIIGWR